MSLSPPVVLILLLGTSTMLQISNQCTPVNGNCSEECYAYEQAKEGIQPTYLNVRATLSETILTPHKFNRMIGKDYEKDSMRNVKGQACYHESNAIVGCKEFIEVEEACSWTYECNYDKNRLPLYIWKASCDSDSETLYYPMPVLKRSDSCNPQPTWQLVMEKVPVGCSCQED